MTDYVRYVNSIGSKNNDGTLPDKDHAWLVIQDSLDKLRDLLVNPGDSGELRICSGDYYENLTMDTDKYSRIEVVGRTGRGDPFPDYTYTGYLEPTFCEQRPRIFGQNIGSVFTIRDVVDVTLKDLNISQGKAKYGGGVSVTGSQVTIRRCCIHGNQAEKSGAGIAFYGCVTGRTTVHDCFVMHNQADEDGGGAWFSDSADIAISNTRYYANDAHKNGGAIALDGCSDVVISDACTFGGPELTPPVQIASNELIQFLKNTAKEEGGALYVRLNKQNLYIGLVGAGIEPNKFEYNEANAGGAIAIVSKSAGVSLHGNEINRNQALHLHGRGGGIYVRQFDYFSQPDKAAVEKCKVTLDNHKITFNGTEQTGSGGGIYADWGSNLELTDNSITQNVSGKGGGIYAGVGSTIALKDNTLTDNAASDGIGGGLYARNSNVSAVNTDISHNSAAFGGGLWITTGFLHGDETNFLTRIQFLPQGAQVNLGPGITIAINSAQTKGAGLGCEQGDIPINLDIHNTTITANTSVADGGGIWLKDVATAAVRDCVFDGNIAASAFVPGAAPAKPALYVVGVGDGGAVYVDNSRPAGTTTMTNNQIRKNSAGNGAGIFMIRSDIDKTTVTANTFDSNTQTNKHAAADIYLKSSTTSGLTNAEIAWANFDTVGILSALEVSQVP